MSSDRRYGMAVDARACVGCNACAIACKTEHDVPMGRTRRWVNQRVAGRFPDLTMQVWSECCHHCDDPPCVDNCPTGASHVHTATGTVQVDRNRCTGCKSCMAACPYGARFVHPGGWIDKCTLCRERLGTGRSTACEEVCPTSAITVGDLDDASSDLAVLLRRRGGRRLKEAAGTSPRFYLID